MAIGRALIIFFVILGAAASIVIAWAVFAICAGRRSGKVDTEGERQQVEYMREARMRNRKEMAAHHGFRDYA
jgi:hypothetical protein